MKDKVQKYFQDYFDGKITEDEIKDLKDVAVSEENYEDAAVFKKVIETINSI